jgi:hypothetical protein
MGNQSPELSRIKVNKLINGAGWTLSLSPDYFFKLNSRLCEEEGRSLFALAETDPTTAYDYLRHVIGVSIVSYADEIPMKVHLMLTCSYLIPMMKKL